MGRTKTPTNIKKLRGTLQPCRTIKLEVVFDELESAKAPDELDEEGKKEWDRIFPILKSRGLITKVDYQMLLNYCFIVSRMKYVRGKILNEDIIYYEMNAAMQKVPKVNKYITAYKDFFSQMVALSARFGFSPADRTKINLPKQPASADLESEFIRKAN